MSYWGIAGHPGFEPGTYELTARCSAVELVATAWTCTESNCGLTDSACGFILQSTPFQALERDAVRYGTPRGLAPLCQRTPGLVFLVYTNISGCQLTLASSLQEG